VCIIEDMPYPENRVAIDDNEADGVRIKYTIKKELRDRTARFRELLSERLKNRRLVFLSQDVELNSRQFLGQCSQTIVSIRQMDDCEAVEVIENSI